MKSDKSSGTLNRRSLLKGAGTTIFVGAGIIGSSALPSKAFAETDIPASAEKKCATCRFWGGIRQISADKQTVTADGKGWCNNPESPAYQKQTEPTQGAPVWTKWAALD